MKHCFSCDWSEVTPQEFKQIEAMAVACYARLGIDCPGKKKNVIDCTELH